MHPNRLVEEAIRAELIPEGLVGYEQIRREAAYDRGCRIDFLLRAKGRPDCFVEVKNVHLKRALDAEFPDTATARGVKHLRALGRQVAAGARAIVVYVVQRTDCVDFRIAADIDPTYAAAFGEALASGVETLCWICRITLEEIRLAAPLQMVLPEPPVGAVMMHEQLKVAEQATSEVQVPLHDAAAFASMHRAGQLAAAVLDMIDGHVHPGVTTGELDRLCHAFILDHGAVPAPLNYRGYPKSICTSINQEVCHGIPSEGRVLRDGDILNIDVTVILDGWHGDTSRMFFAGTPPLKARRLCKVTYEALWRGIGAVRAGATLGDVGQAIQSYAERFRYSVVQDYCGHGIGRVFHDAPSVLHYFTSREKKPKTDQVSRQPKLILRPGMIFTIEPMINAGDWDAGGWKVKLNKKDGWTVVTRDGQLSAQFEHTVGVTEEGCEVFTLSPAGLDHPEW